MLKPILTAASLAILLAGPAAADNDARRGKGKAERETTHEIRPKPSKPSKYTVLPDRGPDRRNNGNGDRDRGNDRDRDRGHDRDRDRDRDRDHDRRRDHDRDWDRDRDRDWDRDRHRGHDRHDWRDHDWRRDDDWRRRGWHYFGGRNDGWRYYRGHDHRHWRYVPPSRYRVDFGYRSGYELAWRDWLAHGRYDRYWRRQSFYGYGVGLTYRAGYDAGWRDAAYYYGRGYRPNYWAYDPSGGWYFGFSISG